MKGILFQISILFVLGCGSIATKGDLPPTDFQIPKEKKGSVVYRFYTRTPYYRGGVILENDQATSDQFKQFLLDSNYFINVDEYPLKFESVNLTGSNTQAEENLALQIKFPIEADYFLDIESELRDMGPHGYMYWGMFHVLSLGLIPIAINNDIKLKVTLYDRYGKKLNENKISDTSTIWGWTPLILFNGFQIFRDVRDTSKPIKQNAFRYGVKNFWDQSYPTAN